MNHTPPSRTTGRWIAVVALPTLAALSMFYLARVAEPPLDGWLFSTGLCFVVIASCIGPLVVWAGRTSKLEVHHEDDLADVRYRLNRTEADRAAQSEVLEVILEALRMNEPQAVGGYPDGPSVSSSPQLWVVRDEDTEGPRPEWN